MDFMLPFKVGDLVESRSFSPGYRGAWFTSKISLMCVRQGHLECLLEFIDFPDEKKTWTRLYKIRPGYRKQQSSENRDIMIRPTFPQRYLENQLAEQHPKPNVMLVVTNPWKVGDLIEWRHTDCCWSGKIIELLGDDKVKIALHDPPIGEGGYYEADCKDLRPALDWSLEKGWSVPVSQENGECWFNARLIIQKTDTENSSADEENEPSHDGGEVRECLNVPSDVPVEVMETGTELPPNTNDKVLMYNQRDGKEEDLNCLNGTSDKPREVENSDVNLPPNQNGRCCTQGETEHPSTEGGESLDAESSPLSLKRRKISTEPTSVDRSADIITTIDDNMIELEKVADRIRRLQNLLSVESDQSSVPKDSWKFLDKEASTKQK